MKKMIASMRVGGALAGMMVAAAYSDFDMDEMYRKNSRALRRAKRKFDRQMHAMGIM
ncbi:MAG: hypothetical protein IJR47_04910 [Clostridia bacterium]|nr:hypothetical protein [Clostridia bacterium]